MRFLVEQLCLLCISLGLSMRFCLCSFDKTECCTDSSTDSVILIFIRDDSSVVFAVTAFEFEFKFEFILALRSIPKRRKSVLLGSSGLDCAKFDQEFSLVCSFGSLNNFRETSVREDELLVAWHLAGPLKSFNQELSMQLL